MANILSPEEVDALITQFSDDDSDDSETSGDVSETAASERPSGPPSRTEMAPAVEYDAENVEMLLSIPIDIGVEIGRTHLNISEILELCQGSVIELDRLASDLIELVVNDKVIASGEAVVINENFGLRILEVDSVRDRIKKL